MDQYRLNEALETLWELISYGDKYINEKKPWETGDKNAVANARELVDQVAELLKPFLPETSEKIIKGEPGTLFPRL
jgi:methionyl-tRNA synthetase